MGFGELVPQLFEPYGGFKLSIRPEQGNHFAECRYQARFALSRCFNSRYRASHHRGKAGWVWRSVMHYLGQRLGGV
jgi:hypothetical protein